MCVCQLKRLSQLEDVVAEQDASLSALRDKLTWARTAAQDARLAQQQAAQHHDKLTQQYVTQHVTLQRL